MLTLRAKETILDLDGRCLRCGATESLSVDHIVPTTLGGSDDLSNLQTLCLACNTKKGQRCDDYRSEARKAPVALRPKRTVPKDKMNGEGVKVVNHSLLLSTVASLKEQAKKEDRSASRIVDQAVREYIERQSEGK